MRLLCLSISVDFLGLSFLLCLKFLYSRYVLAAITVSISFLYLSESNLSLVANLIALLL